VIKKVAFVGHPTRDMAAAKRFYGELLGLAPSADFLDVWSEFKAPDGTTVALDAISPQHAEDGAPLMPYLSLETDDIEAEVARLREQGVTVLKDVWTNKHDDGTEVCRMAIVADPSGLGVMLHQIAASRA
jgi:predicted enzyme related to lactoylglutathione lyase